LRILKKYSLILIIIIGSSLLGLVATTYYKVTLTNQLSQPLLLTINSGTSFNSFTKQLVKNEVVASRFWLRNYARVFPESTKIKAGTYQILPNETLKSTLEMITKGNEYQFSITFVEGTTFKQWLTQLKNQEGINHQISDKANATQKIVQLLSITHSNPEGLFFPDTYAYTYQTSDVEILKRAYLKMQVRLNEAWLQRASGLPYTQAYQALTMASIIEKESGKFAEHEIISSVFVNRLDGKMRLQTDPTVIYGLGERYKGDIKRKHLREKTAYNTYRINGLPPTPIAMPGQSAIDAAMNPAETDYFYFVSNGEGQHIFSTTLVEHNKAVVKYQLAK